MSKHRYVIQWKSKVNGRAGRGTKEFDRPEAERLVTELNREYPQIVHEVITAPKGAVASAQTISENESIVTAE